jgi:glycosyltransferase involved in cell wall biosynthesis
LILRDLGFEVHALDFTDHRIEPDGRYDVVLGIDGELIRLADLTGASHRLLHLTGSYGPFQNAAEAQRLAALEARRGLRCVPRRQIADLEGPERALRGAQARSLVGNTTTRDTYPAELRDAITCVPVSPSWLPPALADRPLTGGGDDFLWFFGSGAVHKGLDLVLEAFVQRPERVLHVVGNIASETDFVDGYRRELYELPNIHFHGVLDPSAARFADVVSRCAAVVAPSCSEGTSPAVVTALQLGLLPIITAQTGVDLPADAGSVLPEVSVAAIAEAVEAVAALPAAERVRRARAVRDDARSRYSRERFDAVMRMHLTRWLG